MKKFADLPIYFIIIGFILNIIMYLYNEVSFTSLMIRSSIVVILFAAMGAILAYVLNDAQRAIENQTQNEANKDDEAATSTFDIRVNSEDDDELFNLMPQKNEDEFAELSIQNFKRFMDQDRN